MAHSAEQVKADKATIDAGRCPETGRDLSALPPAAIRAHAQFTFPHANDVNMRDSDHARRYRLVMAYADSREAK